MLFYCIEKVEIKILLTNTKYVSEFIICAILAMITYGMLKSITKRNTYGNKVFNKLISIRKHIELQDDIQIYASLLPFIYMLKLKKDYSFLDQETERLNELACECLDILNSQELMKNEGPLLRYKNIIR